MRIVGRPGDMMADSDAETGVGTRSGSTLEPARMTAAERKALRDKLAADIAAAKAKADAEAAERKAAEVAASRQARMDELKTEREQRTAATVAARAEANPMFDPTNRPDAPPADDDFIYYYSWIGGVSTGEWKLYRAVNNQSNQNTYGARAVGGQTQSDGTSTSGANALEVQPQPIKDGEGNTIGWTSSTTGIATGGTPSGVTGGSPAGSTGGTSAGTPGGATGGTPAGGTTGGTTGGATGGTPAGGTAGGTAAGAITYRASDGRVFTNADAYVAYQANLDKGTAERKSAYDLLYSQFGQYGLQSLVAPLEGLIKEGVPASEFAIRLRETPAYRQRFGANQARINRGLTALSEAEYIGLEDAYQNIMRQYGLPETYYRRGELGRQEGFEKFISADVSPVELEQRISTAYNRVINANPEVSIALKTFYPNITNGDILSYALDPERALDEINRKITAAEIGASAVQAGLTTNESDAAYLARYGITKEQARQGYRTISGYLPRAQQLSDIYGKQVEGGPYTQASAEREVFGTPGAAEEERKRRKITELETAQFSGQSGVGALARERAGQF